MNTDKLEKLFGIPFALLCIYYIGYTASSYHNDILGLDIDEDILTITHSFGNFVIGSVTDFSSLSLFYTRDVFKQVFSVSIVYPIITIIILVLVSLSQWTNIMNKKRSVLMSYVLFILFLTGNLFLLKNELKFLAVKDFTSLNANSIFYNQQSDLNGCERQTETYELYKEDILASNHKYAYNLINYFDLNTSLNLEYSRALLYCAFLFYIFLNLSLLYLLSGFIKKWLLLIVVLPAFLILPPLYGTYGKSYYMPFVEVQKEGQMLYEGYLLSGQDGILTVFNPSQSFNKYMLTKESYDNVSILFRGSVFDSPIIGYDALCAKKLNYD